MIYRTKIRNQKRLTRNGSAVTATTINYPFDSLLTTYEVNTPVTEQSLINARAVTPENPNFSITDFTTQERTEIPQTSGKTISISNYKLIVIPG
jgi:hypothetical protein